jgi:hypothetical protein
VAKDKEGVLVGRSSFKRVADVTREVETARGLPGELRGPNRRRAVPQVEGYLLDDLAGTDDPNVPTSARFQIMTPLQGVDGWALEPSPSIVRVINRSPASWSAPAMGFAAELQQDKWYFSSPASGGGSHRIWFTIDEVECVGTDGDKILTVYVDDYTGGCTGPIPGEDSYGRVKVYGKCSTMKLYVAENMLDKQGSATWWFPRTGYCVPRWLVDDLCIIPTCTGSGSSGG